MAGRSPSLEADESPMLITDGLRDKRFDGAVVVLGGAEEQGAELEMGSQAATVPLGRVCSRARVVFGVREGATALTGEELPNGSDKRS